MRSYDPNDKYDQETRARYDAPAWMVEQLALNPSYVHWGPHEDYMWVKGEGWNSPVIHQSWEEGKLGLNELNEVANFYFEIGRPSKECPECGGKGNHPDSQWISESFYQHSSPFTEETAAERQAVSLLASFEGPGASHSRGVLGRGALPPGEVLARYGHEFYDFCVRTMERGGAWHDDITEDEAEALAETRRKKTAAEWNAEESTNRIFGHDAINRWILIKARCKRLGVPYECPKSACYDGRVVTGPAYLTLVLWVLHPRKGCSRGWEINNITEPELPAVYAFLREAAKRNADRFGKVPS